MADELISVVKVDIIKPIGATWEEAGPILHHIRFVAHRCMNAAITACALATAANDKTHPQTVAYRAVGAQLEREREFTPGLDVGSGIQATWSKAAADKFMGARKAMWRGEQSLPSYKRGAPIMVRKADWDFNRDAKGYYIDAKLLSGRTGRMRFALVAEGGNAHAALRMGLSKESERCDLKIVYDERRKRWEARLTFKRPRPLPPPTDAKRALCVHRGMRAMLTCATTEGETRVISGGEQVLAFKNQMHRRRRGWYAHKKSASDRNHGRGYWRRYEMYRNLEDKEARFVDTICKQNAAHVIKLAVMRGCGTIVVDDWSARQLAGEVSKWQGSYAAWIIRRWPFAQQRDAITQAASKAGLEVVTVPAGYESITCPQCTNVDASQDNGRGMFRCAACGFERGTDSVAALNALRSAGYADVLAKQPDCRAALTAARAQAVREVGERPVGERSGDAQKAEGARDEGDASHGSDIVEKCPSGKVGKTGADRQGAKKTTGRSQSAR